ncbi:MAG TPA: tRNA (guanosine(46)-N7)-methyltransferase TrmB [Lachnospiraceae bacterium]
MRLRNIPRAAEAIAKSPYVVQEPKSFKGKWKEYFGNENPIHIEIGMGKGRFIMDMARLHPEINYIGIERYDSVLFRGVQKREELGKDAIKNLVFLCIDAKELEEVFDKNEVTRIYLNFSDPWPKDRHAKRRLTSHQFLLVYEKFLAKNGLLEFKTDNKALFDFSLEEVPTAGWTLLESTYDLHHQVSMCEGNVMTEYEEKFSSMGHPICKMIIQQ